MITLITDFGQSREDWGLEFEEERWLDLRKGKITATTAYLLIRPKKPLTLREALKYKEENADFQGNSSTHRGKILEPEARELYQDLHKVQVQQVAAVFNDKYPLALSSPDGLVGEDGGLEIKCFETEHHLKLFKRIDPEIIAQIQFNLFISERKWWDFFAYNPEMEDLSQVYFEKRFLPDLAMHDRFRKALSEVLI